MYCIGRKGFHFLLWFVKDILLNKGDYMRTIHIPTINDENEDFERLFEILESVNTDTDDIEFDFSYCDFLRQNAVAFLGGIARYIQKQDRGIRFRFDTMKEKIFTNLRQNGFTSYFSFDTGPWDGNSIPYIETSNDENILPYLEHNWLGKGWINVSDNLKNAIIGKVYEIFANAYEHSSSPVGVFSCGQRFRFLNELKLTVVDFGVGIHTNVKNYLGDPSLNIIRAIEWAFVDGHSTRETMMYKGGLGLGVLKDFIETNDGKLEIYTHNGYCIINKNGIQFEETTHFFSGTLVNITLKCNEVYYSFEDEVEEDEKYFI